ncbi:uncharacterized protein LOC111057898 [Nilaparvata lugens]|uniref:uncharacterized protein LOC111057898 n=1 Tax=Nilaparvata lugens TaxID=108931 RepID=UPI00193E9CD8|nr:uncharacterized protein LOC111057898 [Nilaparvata lugens]
MSATAQQLFELKCIAKCTKVRLSAVSQAQERQLIALVLSSGDLVLYHTLKEHEEPQVRWIPWFEEAAKEVQCLTFDPLSGAWLLLACFDGSLQIVPIFSLFGQRTPPEAALNNWSRDDVTSVHYGNAANLPATELCPTAVTWWVRQSPDVDRTTRDIAIVGTKSGHVIFVSLLSATVMGSTTFDGAITSLSVCRSDDSLSEETTIILLVTGLNQQQWKVILEHRETGNYWPFLADSKLNDSSISSGSYEPDEHSRLSFPSFPSARTRLQGLKQLSVEKLTSLRQKITDTRSRGLAGGSSLKRKNSSSSEDSLSRFRLPVEGGADGSVPNSPRVLSMANIQLTAQHLHKRTFLTSYYSPVNIVTVFCTSVDMNPVSVHKLCVPCGSLLLCDHLFYVKSADGKKLSIISTRLSECHANSEKHLFNSDAPLESMLQEFVMDHDEYIMNLHRIPAIPSTANEKLMDGRKSHRNKKGKSGCSHMEVNCKDLCAVVTNLAVYIVKLRAVHEEVLACVKDVGRMEEGERLARIFGLDLQKLLELAADQQLDAGMLESGISLYTLSKCRPLKSVLRLAAAGYTVHMLQHILALLKAVELSPSEQLHLSNLCLLSYTEQILRSKAPERNNLTNSFKEFLSENSQYDEALAVNIIAQSGLCRILTHLSNNRGVHTLVADILARLLTHFNDQAHRIDLELADGFWECLSDSLLWESYIVHADVARAHIDFVKHKLPLLTETVLERLAFAYDPSRPALRPVIHRYILEIASSSESKLNGMTTIDLVQSPDSIFPFSDWLTLYLMTCVYLAHARTLTLTNVDLLSLSPDHNLSLSDCSKPHFPHSPTVPHPLPVLETPFVKPPILNAGFTHAGLIRNKQLIMWGQTANGCLGSGPNLNKASNPSVVGLFPQLSLSVIGVACGRFHTLALTENGVYSWGSSKYGQLGVGKVMQSSQPRLVETLANRRVVTVECGQYHSMALTDDGKLYTWGWGVHGQLGHGSVEDCHYPTLVQNLSNQMCVSCSGGHAHTLALMASGRVWAFGSSVFGQLGTGNNVKSSRPVQVYGLPENIVMISTAYFHNLGLAASNRLYTWGSSPQVLRLQAQAQKRARARAHALQQMQQDSGADGEAATPTPPTTLNLATPTGQSEEAAGEDADAKASRPHFKMAPTSRFVTMNSEMVVSPSTEMKALPTGRDMPSSASFTIENGPASNPVVGLDDALAHLSPTLVDTSHVEGRITMISCGCHHSALLTDNGRVHTWGRNLDGQLGNGVRTKEALHPTQINIGNCGCHHSALLTDNGRVHTWGRNLDGQLGNGVRTKEALHPTQINIGDPVEADVQYVVCGGEFTLCMESNGRVRAWGSNVNGQLGRAPIEDSTKTGMVLLKTSKRIIKLPHGSLNTADSPKEITGLPPYELYDSGESSVKMYQNGVKPLADMESPPHGLRTLHYALHQYRGYYNSTEILNKCLELEDWCTASKLFALDGHVDRALRYRLKAVAAAAAVNDSTVSTPVNKTSTDTTSNVEDDDVTVTVTTTTDATEGSEDTETSSSSPTSATVTTRKVVMLGGEQVVMRIHEPRQCRTCHHVILPTIDDSTTDDTTDDSEIHTFAVQGGTEEMSSCSQDSDTAKTSDTPSLSDDVFESGSETPLSDTHTTSTTNQTFSCCQEGIRACTHRRRQSSLVQQSSYESTATLNDEKLPDDKIMSDAKMPDDKSSVASSGSVGGDFSSAEKAYRASIDNYVSVVASYLKEYADSPVPVIRDILYQTLDFWIEQSLPVSTLENFLKEHWGLVHYPLGVLLFGSQPYERSSDAEKILCRLSIDFTLLLCNSMVDHVSDKRKPCPEMIDMLAGLSWNGAMDTDCNTDTDTDTDARLNRVLDNLCNPQEVQPFIDISFPVSDSCSGEVIAFSCGHRYEGAGALNKATLGAANSLHSLPATAHALQHLYQQPQMIRHFACPTCILGCIEAEIR